MSEYKMIEQNGRIMPKEDKMFRINGLCKAAQEKLGDKVIAATLGTLADDEGKQIMLPTVIELMRNLTAEEYAEYAPICGTAKFRKYVQEAAFWGHQPKDRVIDAVVTPGGSGAIGAAFSTFTKYDDKMLVSDWHWSTYKTIAQEHKRGIATYRLFNEEGKLDAQSLEEEAKKLMDAQGSLLVILNTPAQNPTGYSFTLEDWDKTLAAFKRVAGTDKKLFFLVDMAYIDFAGDYHETRKFFEKFEGLPKNIVPLCAFSLSKSFTLYGARCGALICMSPDEESAAEFRQAAEFTLRGTWSNCPMAPMAVLTRIYDDPALLKKVTAERDKYKAVLEARGHAFEKAAAEIGLKTVPFDSGYFVSIPYPDQDALIEQCIKHNAYLIPTTLGVRASVAAITEENCRKLPAIIKQAIEELEAAK